MRILWIEDDPGVVRWGTEFLRRHDFHVDVAVNGSSGLERARRSQHSLIILDWWLPEREFSGAVVLRELYACCAGTPILVCSGTDEEALARSQGASGFYLKPLHPAEFLHCLRRVLHAEESFGEPRSAAVALSRRERAWQERLLANDPTVADEIAAAFLAPLRVRLRGKMKGAGEHTIETAVEDALMAFCRRPDAYHAHRIPLMDYLLLIARRRALNALTREARHQRKYVTTGLTVPELVATGEECRSQWREVRALLRACQSPAEKAFMRARLLGENRVGILCGLLGRALDAESDQRAEVRKTFERIRLRVRRSSAAPRSKKPRKYD